MFSYFSIEERIPADHLLRRVKAHADEVLGSMGTQFDAMYATAGRPSVAPERLLKATLLIESWASFKSFKRKDGEPPKSGSDGTGMVDFKGEKRSNKTHESSTDPEAKP